MVSQKYFLYVHSSGILGNKIEGISMENYNIVEEEEKRSAGFGTSSRWRIMRNRWNLAYTLINNPSLAQYRKQNLDNDQSQEKNCQDKEVEHELTANKKDLSNGSRETTPTVSI